MLTGSVKFSAGLLLVLLLAGCDDPEQAPVRQSLSAIAVLAGSDVDGFRRAVEPREFSFPADHGQHPGYRNEWWYITGNLASADGRRFGYQVTFFATAMRPDRGQACPVQHDWCTDIIWMAHAAISDANTGRHLAAEIFSRQEPGLAGAQADPLHVWVQDWQLFGSSAGLPWELEVVHDDFAISLSLAPEKGPVLQGDNGLSRKSPEPGNASYYYSLTRIRTSGQLFVDGNRFEVSGYSWLDREWGTSALAPDQDGWDWFALQLDDGSEVMYYQLRDTNGGAHASSAGSFTSLMGGQAPISREEVMLDPLATWQAHDGTLYDTRWRMRYRNNDWIVQALFDDQLMDLTYPYWEGAVDVIDAITGNTVGRGYLEMVRR